MELYDRQIKYTRENNKLNCPYKKYTKAFGHCSESIKSTSHP